MSDKKDKKDNKKDKKEKEDKKEKKEKSKEKEDKKEKKDKSEKKDSKEDKKEKKDKKEKEEKKDKSKDKKEKSKEKKKDESRDKSKEKKDKSKDKKKDKKDKNQHTPLELGRAARAADSRVPQPLRNSMWQTDVLNTVGNTPLVKLRRFSPNPDVEIWVKLEFLNPSGSIKDRIVQHIIADAEEKGLLKPGGTIVENTSGNTGAAVAMIAAAKGYKAILTMPDKVSIEKQNTLRAYGAELVVCPTSAPPGSPDHYEEKCHHIHQSIPGSFKVNQYDNLKNPEAHYRTTGPEIWAQMDGRIDWFVASGSTGGTVTGIGRYLKEQDPKVQVYMPDPVGSIYFEYFHTRKEPKDAKGCTYYVEGIGEDHVCKAIDFGVVDRMGQFNDAEAFACVRRLAREEGILAGGSSGANLWGALQLASQIKGPARIVTVLPDSGTKYLTKCYNDEWMKEKKLL